MCMTPSRLPCLHSSLTRGRVSCRVAGSPPQGRAAERQEAERRLLALPQVRREARVALVFHALVVSLI